LSPDIECAEWMAFRTMLGARSTFVARWYRSSLATRGPSPLCATPSHSIRRTASLPTMLRKMIAPLRGMIVLHDHSRDSAAAAMSSAAWIPWPRSLALASLGRTSSRSGASLTAQVVELAGFLGRSGDPVVTIGSVGRSDSCLATGARLGRSNGQIDHVPERHPRLLVFILANIDQVVIAILDETELRRTPDCERDRQQDGHCQVRSVRFEPVRVAPPRPVAIKLKIRAGLGDVFPASVRLPSQANASPLAAGAPLARCKFAFSQTVRSRRSPPAMSRTCLDDLEHPPYGTA